MRGSAAPAARLAARLAPGLVETGPGVWRYACAGVAPGCVVRPRTAVEVRAAVEAAAYEGLCLLPCGEGVDLGLGRPPKRYDAALCLREVREPWRHDARDFVLTVGAGMPLGEIDQRLAPHGQWLPLDPPLAERRTAGGVVAAGRSGPVQVAYGRVRDLVLGVRAVRGDGAWLAAGGRVVKNVAGYDLCRLLTGSFGTLAALVEVTFRLHPRPACRRAFLVRRPSLAELIDFAFERLRAPIPPESLEILNGAAAEQVGVAESPAALVAYAGSPVRVDAAARDLDRCAGGGAEEIEGEERESVLRALRDFSHTAEEDFLVARLAVPRRFLGETLERVEREAERRGLVAEVSVRPGCATADLQLGGPAGPLEVSLFAEWIRIHARQRGGWLVFGSLPAELRERVDPWGMSGAAVELMRRVKAALDPQGRFAPGRFAGGI